MEKSKVYGYITSMHGLGAFVPITHDIQKTAIERWAINCQCQILKYFDDIKSTSYHRSIMTRRGIIEYIQNMPENSVLIVFSIYAVSNNMSDYLEFIAFLKDKNVTLCTVVENINLGTVNGKCEAVIAMSLQELVIDLENERNAETMQMPEKV